MSSGDWPAFRRSVKALGVRGQRPKVRKPAKHSKSTSPSPTELTGDEVSFAALMGIGVIPETTRPSSGSQQPTTKQIPKSKAGAGSRIKPGMTPTARAARDLKPLTLDLHGMTQAAAYAALSQFLITQQQRGTRQVLIITGKGRGGEGLLKRNLPHWCESPELSKFIESITIAPPRLGGSGAFVLMVRRKT